MTFPRSLSFLLCGLACWVLLSGLLVSAAEETATVPKKAAALISILEDDWEQILTGEWMVEFHAPWCPACRALQPDWKTFSGWSKELGIKVGAVDVTANPGLSGRFLVTALPTIYHVKDGVFRQFKGTRDVNTFVSFIEEKKWQSIEPLTNWKSPDSVQMSFVSSLFRISMALRSVHNSLVEDYGIPYWGSYIVFAFSTILFGAILGLLIVCVIDVIWPAKLSDAPRPSSKSSKKDDDVVADDVATTDESEKSSGAEEEEAIEEVTTDDDKATTAGKGGDVRKRRVRKE